MTCRTLWQTATTCISHKPVTSVFFRFLTHILTCYPVSILICLRLHLSTVHNLSLPLYHAITPSFSYPDSLAHHIPFYNDMEKEFSCLITWPSHLCLTVVNMLRVSLARTNTSWLFSQSDTCKWYHRNKWTLSWENCQESQNYHLDVFFIHLKPVVSNIFVLKCTGP